MSSSFLRTLCSILAITVDEFKSLDHCKNNQHLSILHLDDLKLKLVEDALAAVVSVVKDSSVRYAVTAWTLVNSDNQDSWRDVMSAHKLDALSGSVAGLLVVWLKDDRYVAGHAMTIEHNTFSTPTFGLHDYRKLALSNLSSDN